MGESVNIAFLSKGKCKNCLCTSELYLYQEICDTARGSSVSHEVVLAAGRSPIRLWVMALQVLTINLQDIKRWGTSDDGHFQGEEVHPVIRSQENPQLPTCIEVGIQGWSSKADQPTSIQGCQWTSLKSATFMLFKSIFNTSLQQEMNLSSPIRGFAWRIVGAKKKYTSIYTCPFIFHRLHLYQS